MQGGALATSGLWLASHTRRYGLRRLHRGRILPRRGVLRLGVEHDRVSVAEVRVAECGRSSALLAFSAVGLGSEGEVRSAGCCAGWPSGCAGRLRGRRRGGCGRGRLTGVADLGWRPGVGRDRVQGDDLRGRAAGGVGVLASLPGLHGPVLGAGARPPAAGLVRGVGVSRDPLDRPATELGGCRQTGRESVSLTPAPCRCRSVSATTPGTVQGPIRADADQPQSARNWR